jgi:hypothetical protein
LTNQSTPQDNIKSQRYLKTTSPKKLNIQTKENGIDLKKIVVKRAKCTFLRVNTNNPGIGISLSIVSLCDALRRAREIAPSIFYHIDLDKRRWSFFRVSSLI